jgi:hypothetical protein
MFRRITTSSSSSEDIMSGILNDGLIACRVKTNKEDNNNHDHNLDHLI